MRSKAVIGMVMALILMVVAMVSAGPLHYARDTGRQAVARVAAAAEDASGQAKYVFVFIGDGSGPSRSATPLSCTWRRRAVRSAGRSQAGDEHLPAQGMTRPMT